MLPSYLVTELVKAAAKESKPYPNMKQHAHYMYAPLGDRRELTSKEQADIEEGQTNWMPEVFQSYGTEPKNMMASPGKQALLAALLGGASGAVAGGLYGAPLDASGSGALIGGALGAVPAGVLAYLRRKAMNRDIVELMRRSPPGAVKRDLVADPVYQKDQDRGVFFDGRNPLASPGTLAGLYAMNKMT